MRRTKEERIRIVENYRASGLSVRCFCKDAGIAEQSLRNWITHFNAVAGENTDRVQPQGFVEVPPIVPALTILGEQAGDPIPAGMRKGLNIRFLDGTVIEIHPDTDRHTLEWVLTLMANRK